MDRLRRVELKQNELLVYKGMEIDRCVLDAVVDGTSKRLLWAFVRKGDVVMAVPYSEEHVIWMSVDDVMSPDEVEM